jgi:prevent-host-death family protein
MYQVSIEEAKKTFPKLLKAALEGEEIIIAKGAKPVAKLISINGEKPQRKLGTAKAVITIASDFDEPLKEFSEYQ